MTWHPDTPEALASTLAAANAGLSAELDHLRAENARLQGLIDIGEGAAQRLKARAETAEARVAELEEWHAVGETWQAPRGRIRRGDLGFHVHSRDERGVYTGELWAYSDFRAAWAAAKGEGDDL